MEWIRGPFSEAALHTICRCNVNASRDSLVIFSFSWRDLHSHNSHTFLQRNDCLNFYTTETVFEFVHKII